MENGKLIPEGPYPAKVVDIALGKAKTGTEQVAVQFEITAGDHSGQTYTYYGYFTEKSMDYTFDALDAIGWNSRGFDEDVLESMKGTEAQIVIRHEDDDKGNARARVRFVNAPNAITMERLDSAELGDLHSRIKGKLLARRQGKPPAESDDDLPF